MSTTAYNDPSGVWWCGYPLIQYRDYMTLTGNLGLDPNAKFLRRGKVTDDLLLATRIVDFQFGSQNLSVLRSL